MPTMQYQYPVGGTTPPSVQQALAVNTVAAQIVWGDTDTSQIVTHNFGIVQPNITPYSNGVAGTPVAATGVFPLVQWNVDGSSAGTSVLFTPTFVEVSLTNSVAITIKKPSQVGSNMTMNVVILRPWSGTQ